MTIHKTAIVDSSAELGNDVTVGPYAIIEKDVTIGDGSVVGAHAVIYPHTSLGNGCKVHAFAVLGDTPQDLHFAGHRSYVDIGNNCTMREGVTIHRGAQEDSRTTVGDNCFFMACSHVGHDAKLGPGVIVANGVLFAGFVEVGEGAFLAGNAVVHQFVRIGRLAMISGNAGVSKDIPPFCTAPACELNRVTGLNVVGMRRAGMGPEKRKEVKDAFKLVYRSGLNTSQAVGEIAAMYPDGPAAEFGAFIEASERGIARLSTESDE